MHRSFKLQSHMQWRVVVIARFSNTVVNYNCESFWVRYLVAEHWGALTCPSLPMG